MKCARSDIFDIPRPRFDSSEPLKRKRKHTVRAIFYILVLKYDKNVSEKHYTSVLAKKIRSLPRFIIFSIFADIILRILCSKIMQIYEYIVKFSLPLAFSKKYQHINFLNFQIQ